MAVKLVVLRLILPVKTQVVEFIARWRHLFYKFVQNRFIKSYTVDDNAVRKAVKVTAPQECKLLQCELLTSFPQNCG